MAEVVNVIGRDAFVIMVEGGKNWEEVDED